MRDTRYDNVFLYFDEGPHKYTDTLNNEYISTTTYIGKYVKAFNKKYWLHKKAVELGITEKQLEKRWQNITEEACTRGTATHNGIEDAIKDVSMFNKAIQYLNAVESGRCITIADIPNFKAQPLDVDKFIEATNNKYPKIYEVFKFYTDRGYTIYSEIGAFLIDYLISGTIDILCLRPDKFVILDWKTNRKGLQFTSGYYKKDKNSKPHQQTNIWIDNDNRMLPPLAHLPECNGSHYSLQLSIYAYMVETILDIPCVGLGLCHIGSPFVKNAWGMPWLSPEGNYPIDPNGTETVNWYKINYLRKEVEAILNDRLIELKKKPINTQLELGL